MKYHTIGLATALAIAYGAPAGSVKAQELLFTPRGPRIELPERHYWHPRHEWRDSDYWRHREWRRWHHDYEED
jgi:hypothetical protein